MALESVPTRTETQIESFVSVGTNSNFVLDCSGKGGGKNRCRKKSKMSLPPLHIIFLVDLLPTD